MLCGNILSNTVIRMIITNIREYNCIMAILSLFLVRNELKNKKFGKLNIL